MNPENKENSSTMVSQAKEISKGTQTPAVLQSPSVTKEAIRKVHHLTEENKALKAKVKKLEETAATNSWYPNPFYGEPVLIRKKGKAYLQYPSGALVSKH